jgi:hypothetical protein
VIKKIRVLVASDADRRLVADTFGLTGLLGRDITLNGGNGSTVTVPSGSGSSSSGLSESDKIALGTGIGVGVPAAIAGFVAAWYGWRSYQQRRQKKAKTSKPDDRGGIGADAGIGPGDTRATNGWNQQQYEMGGYSGRSEIDGRSTGPQRAELSSSY